MIRIEVNGQNYQTFKQVDVSKSLDDYAGECRIIVNEPQDLDSVIKINSLVQVYLDDILVITGYAESINDTESNASHDVNIRLRSKSQDVIDSSSPDDIKNVEGITLYSDLVKKAILGLGLDISVTDEVGVSLDNEVKSASVGQNTFEYLQEYARKAQVFLNSDGDGNTVIRRPGGVLKTYLIDGFNIEESSINLDYTQRFNTYRVYSNSNVTAQQKTDNFGVVGEAVDNNVRQGRLFEKISEKPMSADECGFAAIEEANIRRIRSFQYTCKVAGFSANGELWEEGKLVNVQDASKGVEGIFVIKDVKYTVASGSGEYTTLTMTEPDAYQLSAELPSKDQGTVILAEPYQE